jgi:carbamoyltransferase
VPVVLNTSFNLRGEPIVHRPAEAVADFLKSDMDALFLGDLLATKPWHEFLARPAKVGVSRANGGVPKVQ